MTGNLSRLSGSKATKTIFSKLWSIIPEPLSPLKSKIDELSKRF